MVVSFPCAINIPTTNQPPQFMFGLDPTMPPPPVKHTAGMLRMLSLQRSSYADNGDAFLIDWLQHTKQRIVDANQSDRLVQALLHVVWPATPAAQEALRGVLDVPACGHGGHDATCLFVAQRVGQHVGVAAQYGTEFCTALVAMV